MPEEKETWWVVVRVDNGYPLIIYKTKEQAEAAIGGSKGEKVVPVQRI
jgi:hypothetical protein